MFEIEMCELKLNHSALKISRIMDFKNHVEITYEITLDKTSFFGKFSVQGVESGSWFKKLNQLEVIKIKLGRDLRVESG